MCTLNKGAKDAALAAGARAATDITGFGFLDHLRNILLGSRVAARVYARDVPVLDFVRDLAGAGLVPGGSKSNLAHITPHCRFDAALSEVDRLVLADAQTSGGLLLAVPPAGVETLLTELRRRRTPAHVVVGEITDGAAGTIEVVAGGR
jgi:selenide,water dikinase